MPGLLHADAHELGWDQPALTAAFSLARLGGGFAGHVIDRILDRHGPRPVKTAVSIGGTLLVLASLAAAGAARRSAGAGVDTPVRADDDC